MTIETLTIRKPDDFHVHLRDGDMLSNVIWDTASVFKRALVMPNLAKKPVLTDCNADLYKERILKAAGWRDCPEFEPLMTIKLAKSTTPEVIGRCKEDGVLAVKLYPAGVTTNSNDGISDFSCKTLRPIFEQLIRHNMVLCIHAESPNIYTPLREEDFIEDYVIPWAKEFPELKIVIEHATTRVAIDVVERFENLAATITVHHLLITMDDVLGGQFNPHLFCKPIAKSTDDRDALVEAACSGDPSFFFGSDSAPHPKEKKHSGCCPAGVYSAPVALPLLAEIFEQNGALRRLEAFVSEHGANYYGLPLNEGTLTLEKRPFRVTDTLASGVRPFWVDKDISWKVNFAGS